MQAISVAEVQRAVALAPAAAGLGLDLWRPRDWAGLPEAAMVELTRLLSQIEQGLAWPSQVLLVLIRFLPKADGISERLIGLTAGLYRLHCQLRKNLLM